MGGKPRVSKFASVEIIVGVGGPSIYVNDYRIAGPKPWGGGRCTKRWVVERENIERALRSPFTALGGEVSDE